MSSSKDELRIEGVAGDWKRVYWNGEHEGYVREVKIAGHEVQIENVAHEITLITTEWDIVKDHYPSLLIEVPEWYTPPEENDE